MSPVQGKGKPSIWRLRPVRDIRSSTDGELVVAVEWLARVQIVFGAIAFVGVALELAIALSRSAAGSLIGNLAPVIGDVFALLGVVGVLTTTTRVILYQGELTSRSNRRLGIAARMAGEAAERAAGANARAAEANERAVQAEQMVEQYRAAHEDRK